MARKCRRAAKVSVLGTEFLFWAHTRRGLSARDKLVKELLDTEAGHVASLELFVSEYVVPLRAASDIVGHDDVVMMASNVELLLSWNQQFLHALKKCLKKDLTRPFAQVESPFSPCLL
jgi:hypothetical protein